MVGREDHRDMGWVWKMWAAELRGGQRPSGWGLVETHKLWGQEDQAGKHLVTELVCQFKH